jgi:hypothetical protein
LRQDADVNGVERIRARSIAVWVFAVGLADWLLIAAAYAWPGRFGHGAHRSVFEVLATKVLVRVEFLAPVGISLLVLGAAIWSLPTIQKIGRLQPSSRWSLIIVGFGLAVMSAGLVNVLVPSQAFPSRMTCVWDYDVGTCHVWPWSGAGPAVALGLVAIVIGAWNVLRTGEPGATPWIRRALAALLAIGILLPLLVLAAATYRPPMDQLCDAPYPAWSGDPCGVGWTNPSLLDYFWPPEHWFAPTRGGFDNLLTP